jgi:hypothetical protein
MGKADKQRVKLADLGNLLVRLRQLIQQIAHGVQACAVFAIAFDHGPG